MGRINGTIVRINTRLLGNYEIKRGSMQLDFYDYMAFVVFGIITTLFVSLVVVIGNTLCAPRWLARLTVLD